MGGVAWGTTITQMKANKDLQEKAIEEALTLIKTNRSQLDTKVDQVKKELQDDTRRHSQDDNRDFKDVKESLGRMWMWKDAHEKETNEVRLVYNTELSKLQNQVSVQAADFKGIIKMFEALEEKIDDLIKSIGRNS